MRAAGLWHFLSTSPAAGRAGLRLARCDRLPAARLWPLALARWPRSPRCSPKRPTRSAPRCSAGCSALPISLSATTGSRPPSPTRRRCPPCSAGSRCRCWRSISRSIPALAALGARAHRRRGTPLGARARLGRLLDARRDAARAGSSPATPGTRSRWCCSARSTGPGLAALAPWTGHYALSGLGGVRLPRRWRRWLRERRLLVAVAGRGAARVGMYLPARAARATARCPSPWSSRTSARSELERPALLRGQFRPAGAAEPRARAAARAAGAVARIGPRRLSAARLPAALLRPHDRVRRSRLRARSGSGARSARAACC